MKSDILYKTLAVPKTPGILKSIKMLHDVCGQIKLPGYMGVCTALLAYASKLDSRPDLVKQEMKDLYIEMKSDILDLALAASEPPKDPTPEQAKFLEELAAPSMVTDIDSLIAAHPDAYVDLSKNSKKSA